MSHARASLLHCRTSCRPDVAHRQPDLARMKTTRTRSPAPRNAKRPPLFRSPASEEPSARVRPDGRLPGSPAPEAPGRTRPDWRLAGSAVGLVLLTLVVYLPTLRNGYIWDDNW